jgi:hypothetical protein
LGLPDVAAFVGAASIGCWAVDLVAQPGVFAAEAMSGLMPGGGSRSPLRPQAPSARRTAKAVVAIVNRLFMPSLLPIVPSNA